jgi:hypothetical protein
VPFFVPGVGEKKTRIPENKLIAYLKNYNEEIKSIYETVFSNRKSGLPPNPPHLKTQGQYDQVNPIKKLQFQFVVLVINKKCKQDPIHRFQVERKIYSKSGKFLQCVHRNWKASTEQKPGKYE